LRKSFCYLFTESTADKATQRLNFLAKNNNGLKIAEYDLKIRGPGEAFSIAQHGFPSLKLANFSDTQLISLGQKIVSKLITNKNFDLNSLITNSQKENHIVSN